jgi:hypothetical protein
VRKNETPQDQTKDQGLYIRNKDKIFILKSLHEAEKTYREIGEETEAETIRERIRELNK